MRGRGCIYYRKDRGSYTARVPIEGQQIYRGGFRTKAAAEGWINATLREAAESEALGLPVLREKVKFKDFVRRWKNAIEPRVTATTYAGYCRVADTVLVPRFGEKRMHQVSRVDVERFVADRVSLRKKRDGAPKPVSPGTINRNLTVLSSVFRLACRLHITRHNPVKGVERARERLPPTTYLREEDEERLFAALPKWLRTPALLALDAGLRAGEIAALTRRDIDLRRTVVVVRTSKNREPREVGLTQRLRSALFAHLRELPTDAASVFSHPDGRPFNSNVYRANWESATHAAEMSRFRFHDLRHACGVRLSERGATPAEIQAYLGHKTLDATLRYIRHAPRDAARTLCELLESDPAPRARRRPRVTRTPRRNRAREIRPRTASR